jgi:hypothetical protein
MKNKFTICLFIATVLVITACEKESALQQRGEPREGAGLKVMHLSPNAPSLNLYVDGTKAIGMLASTDVELGFAFGAILPSLSGGYAIVPAGNHSVSAIVPHSSATLPDQTLVTKNADLVLGKFYTVAIVDSISRLDAVIVEDDLNVPDTSKAYFRIANFMLNGTADVEVTSTTIPGYTFQKNGLAYKSVSAFDTITQATYKILLRANGSATRLDSITAFAPQKGRKYTLYTRGVVGQTGSTNSKRPLIFQMTNL